MVLAEAEHVWGGVAIGAVITAAGAAVVAILTGWGKMRTQGEKATAKIRSERAKAQADKRKTILTEWQAIARWREEQCERQEAVIRQYQEVANAVNEDRADCREETAELRAGVRFLYEHVKRLHGAAADSGHDPGALPEPPPLREQAHESRADFLLRQASQSAALVQEASKAVKAVKPPEGEGTP